MIDLILFLHFAQRFGLTASIVVLLADLSILCDSNFVFETSAKSFLLKHICFYQLLYNLALE
jgi:hypothetical protein